MKIFQWQIELIRGNLGLRVKTISNMSIISQLVILSLMVRLEIQFQMVEAL